MFVIRKELLAIAAPHHAKLVAGVLLDGGLRRPAIPADLIQGRCAIACPKTCHPEADDGLAGGRGDACARVVVQVPLQSMGYSAYRAGVLATFTGGEVSDDLSDVTVCNDVLSVVRQSNCGVPKRECVLPGL